MRRRLGAKTAAALALWTLGVFALAARGALRGRGGIAAAWPIPEFQLTAVDAQGERALGRKDLLGRPWVANFVFTNCDGPCPMLMAGMSELQDTLPEAFRLVSFTVDPDRDDAAALRRYGAAFGAQAGRWIFLRGSKATLYKVIFEGFKQAVLEDPKAPSGSRVVHSTRFALVDKDGVVRGVYEQDDLESLRRHAGRLLKEASHG
ncbi:MAG: SCO family protein [Elusimicrobia bacterium]|nr:SCO family protein [Elusimicrobiota bacterium]